MRIPDRVITDSVKANVSINIARMMKVERELSSGRRINAPSDDPAAAAAALRLRADIAMSEQFTRNVDAAAARLSATDSALGSLTDVLQRARELTVQAGSAGISPGQLTSIGTEINQLLHHAVQIGNSSFGGQFLFSGTKTTTAAFTAVGDVPAAVTYQGNSAAILQDVGDSAQVQMNVTGDQGLLPAMNALIQVRDALNAGDRATAIQGGLTALDAALEGVLQQRGSIGARMNRLESLGVRIADERTNLHGLKGNLEDVDMADTIVRLNSARNVYEAALGAAAQVIQKSLVQFLR